MSEAVFVRYEIEDHRRGRCMWCAAAVLSVWESADAIRTSFACGTTVATSKRNPVQGDYSVSVVRDRWRCVSDVVATVCRDIAAERMDTLLVDRLAAPWLQTIIPAPVTRFWLGRETHTETFERSLRDSMQRNPETDAGRDIRSQLITLREGQAWAR